MKSAFYYKKDKTIQLTNELMYSIDNFEEQFNTLVPICQISAKMTTEHLIESIQKSLNDNVNYLPEIYGYANDGEKLN